MTFVFRLGDILYDSIVVLWMFLLLMWCKMVLYISVKLVFIVMPVFHTMYETKERKRICEIEVDLLANGLTYFHV
jgi:hypothetical protein